MYPLLNYCLERSESTLAQIAAGLCIEESVLDAKLKGSEQFTLDEAIEVRRLLKSELPLRFLFFRS